MTDWQLAHRLFLWALGISFSTLGLLGLLIYLSGNLFKRRQQERKS